MAVPIHIEAQGRLRAGTPEPLFTYSILSYVIENNMWTYSPHPDGRFLVATQSESATQTVNVVTNWGKLAKN